VPDYFAPLEDMRFVIKELCQLKDVLSIPVFQEREIDVDMVDAILEEGGKFANEVLAPINGPGDVTGNKFDKGNVTTPAGFKEAYKQFAEAGWTSTQSEPEYGGQGLPATVSTPLIEMWQSAAMAFSLCPMLTQGAIEALTDNCPDETLKQLYLPKMISGEWTGTMDLTEPQAGSDLGAVRTKAVPEGDHFLITGQKIFITWGEHDMAENIVHLVLARLPDAPEGTKGISLFIAPKFIVNPDGSLGKRNGIECVSIEHKLGIRASATATLAYENAVGYIVGEANRGLEYMFVMMNNARMAVGLQGVSICERSYQAALAYAKERVQSPELGKKGSAVPIIKHADVRRMLMTMKAYTEATRALCYVASALADAAAHHPDPNQKQEFQAMQELLIPVVKGWCTEVGVEVASIGIQVYGGMGYVEETGVAQYLRDAQIAPIYEGTTGIQALDLIGRKVAMTRGATVQALGKQVQETVEKLSAYKDDDDCLAIAETLGRSAKLVGDCTKWLLVSFGGGNYNLAAAGSVAYMRLMGVVIGGWLMGKATLVAKEKLKSGEGNQAFYQAKIVTSRFYADYILSQAYSYAQAITRGGYSVLALDEDQF